MTVRTRSSLLICLFLLLSSGCAARYQSLLRDRDQELGELKGQLSDLRAANAELERRQPASRAPLEASSDQGQFERVQAELDTLDVRMDRGRLSIGIDSTVTFDAGSTAVKPAADGVLRKVARVLDIEFPGRRIYVEGHTDIDPINKTRKRFRDNRHLSVERADAVARYLVEKCGVGESAVVVVGYGPYEPRLPGSSKAAKAKNRRVEIVVGEVL